jgi:hypothetical protein
LHTVCFNSTRFSKLISDRKEKMNAVEKYRKAAQELYGISPEEAAVYIVAPEDDKGGWAPDALAVIYLEADMRTPKDTGTLPAKLSYWGNGMEEALRLGARAGVGFIEHINAAVAAVYE